MALVAARRGAKGSSGLRRWSGAHIHGGGSVPGAHVRAFHAGAGQPAAVGGVAPKRQVCARGHRGRHAAFVGPCLQPRAAAHQRRCAFTSCPSCSCTASHVWLLDGQDIVMLTLRSGL